MKNYASGEDRKWIIVFSDVWIFGSKKALWSYYQPFN